MCCLEGRETLDTDLLTSVILALRECCSCGKCKDKSALFVYTDFFTEARSGLQQTVHSERLGHIDIIIMQLRAAFAHAEWCWRMWSVGSAVAAAQLRNLWHHDPDAFTERVSLRSVAKQHRS